MLAAAELAEQNRGNVVPIRDGEPTAGDRFRENEGRSIEALSLRMAGISFPQIAERMGITADAALELVNYQLSRVRSGPQAEAMRELENSRLDRLQAALWPDALKGDHKAIALVLDISARRARMNGLDAPRQIALSVSVRAEMQQALEDLRSVVLGEVVSEALDDDDEDRDDDLG